MTRWNGQENNAPAYDPPMLTKAGLIAAVVAAQARPECGHIVCRPFDECVLEKP